MKPQPPECTPFEERAAILEYEAGYDRETAERMAKETSEIVKQTAEPGVSLFTNTNQLIR